MLNKQDRISPRPAARTRDDDDFPLMFLLMVVSLLVRVSVASQ
jgi:hypothetical protein